MSFSYLLKCSLQILLNGGCSLFLRHVMLFYPPLMFFFDSMNKKRFGPDAPVFAERIWINPKDCTKALFTIQNINLGQGVSGWVDETIWIQKDACQIPITNVKKIQFCIDHWVNGVAWKDTGIYDLMESVRIENGGIVDGCKNMDDIIKRYDNLDVIYNQIEKEGRFRTMKEQNLKNFRESGGIIIHVGPEGELFLGVGGTHRFVIALILGLNLPAQIGCVHPGSIPLLPKLRQG